MKQIFFMLFMLIIMTSCGVKGPPKIPEDGFLHPWSDRYLKEPRLVANAEIIENRASNYGHELSEIKKSLDRIDQLEGKFDQLKQLQQKKFSPLIDETMTKTMQDIFSLCQNLDKSNIVLENNYFQMKTELREYFKNKEKLQELKLLSEGKFDQGNVVPLIEIKAQEIEKKSQGHVIHYLQQTLHNCRNQGVLPFDVTDYSPWK